MDEKELAIHYATEHSIGAMVSWLGDKKSGAEVAKETSEIVDPKMEAEAQESDSDTEANALSRTDVANLSGIMDVGARGWLSD